jgi:hypothetical protein
MLFIIIALCASCTTKIGDNVEIDIVEAEYDGHSYLIFGGHGVIHNPKCECYDRTHWDKRLH